MGSNRKTLRLDSLENDPVLKEWLLSGLVSEGGLDVELTDSLLDANAITLELPLGERWPEGVVRPLKSTTARLRAPQSGTGNPPFCTRWFARVPTTHAPHPPLRKAAGGIAHYAGRLAHSWGAG